MWPWQDGFHHEHREHRNEAAEQQPANRSQPAPDSNFPDCPDGARFSQPAAEASLEPLKWSEKSPAETVPLQPAQLGLQEIGNHDDIVGWMNSRESDVTTQVHDPASSCEEMFVEEWCGSSYSSSAAEEITALRVQQEKMRWLMFRQQLQLQQLQQMQAMAAFATAQQQKGFFDATTSSCGPVMPASRTAFATGTEAYEIGQAPQIANATAVSNDNPRSIAPNKATKQCKQTMWKDADRPKRPLTAYNLFFKNERAMMLANAEKAAIEQLKVADACFVESNLDRSTGQDECENDRKRPAWDSFDASKSDQGKEVATGSQLQGETRIWTEKIGFADMGREIAKRWRAADMEIRNRFQTMAEEDKKRYVSEKEEYLKRKKKAAGGV